MTTDTFTPLPPYLIQNAGPFAIGWPYDAGAVRAVAILNGLRSELVPDIDFTVTPVASTVGGALVLQAARAAEFDGGELYVTRDTTPEQGWQGVLGQREAGLEAQLDRMTRRLQEQDQELVATLRTDGPLRPLSPVPGRALIFDAQGQPVMGPDAAAITGAAANALLAEASRIAAQQAAANADTSALLAISAQENLFDAWRGDWSTATAYAAGDLAGQGGTTWLCLLDHTSGTFLTDLGAGRWAEFAAKGAAGAGTGDLLAANNLSDVADAAVARLNIGAMKGSSTVVTNWNAAIKDGHYWANSAAANRPADRAYLGMVCRQDDNNLVQLLLADDGQSVALRARVAGSWGAWVPLATRAYADAADLTPTDVAGSRAFSTIYQNTLGRPLQVYIVAVSQSSAGRSIQISADAVTWLTVGRAPSGSVGIGPQTAFVVPVGWYYRIAGSADIASWIEVI